MSDQTLRRFREHVATHFRFETENDGKVATITLDRPAKKNPLTFESYAELRDLFRALVYASDVKAIVVTGAGGNVTAIVDQLEKEGLVERLDEPSDRRAFRIRLTKSGERSFTDMARAHEEWVVELLSGLSRREQDELLRLLARAKEHALERISEMRP